MFFFCKPKTIVLDIFTCHKHLIDLLPPTYANKFRPNWWYKTPPNYDNTAHNGMALKGNTIRRCAGFKDYYSDKAIVIPLWDSFILEYDKSGSRYVFASEENYLEYQAEQLRGGKYLTEFHQFKIRSPWVFKEKTGINFLFSQPFYNFKDPTSFVMPPAIVNYRYQHATNVNFFMRKPEEGEYKKVSLEAGQPLVHLVPITDRLIKIKTHLVSGQELKKLHIPVIYFNGLYSRLKKLGYGATL